MRHRRGKEASGRTIKVFPLPRALTSNTRRRTLDFCPPTSSTKRWRCPGLPPRAAKPGVNGEKSCYLLSREPDLPTSVVMLNGLGSFFRQSRQDHTERLLFVNRIPNGNMSLQVEDISVDDMDAWTCTLVFFFFFFFGTNASRTFRAPWW